MFTKGEVLRKFVVKKRSEKRRVYYGEPFLHFHFEREEFIIVLSCDFIEYGIRHNGFFYVLPAALIKCPSLFKITMFFVKPGNIGAEKIKSKCSREVIEIFKGSPRLGRIF